MGGLLRAAALAVDRHGRDGLGEAGGEDGVAGDVHALLADLVEAAHDHVVEPGPGRSPRARRRGQHLGEQVRRVPPGQHPLAPPDRGADGLDDVRVAAHRATGSAWPSNRGGASRRRRPCPPAGPGSRSEGEPVELARVGARRPPPSARLQSRLAAATAPAGPGGDLRRERERRVEELLAPGGRCDTRPARRASSALTSRPVRIRSFAKPIEVARARRWVPPQPGMIPRVTSGWPEAGASRRRGGRRRRARSRSRRRARSR